MNSLVLAVCKLLEKCYALCLAPYIPQLALAQEAWREQHAVPVLGWCKLVQALFELGCSPLTVMVENIAVPPAPVRIRYNGTSTHLPHWAAEQLRCARIPSLQLRFFFF